MVDTYELRKGDRTLGTVDADDIALEAEAETAKARLEQDLAGDEDLGCDC